MNGWHPYRGGKPRVPREKIISCHRVDEVGVEVEKILVKSM